ncbi:MAG: hypothetical protein RLZZ53_3311, partial [Acidobacteriota bacterium]
MYAGARHFAGGVETGNGRTSPQIGFHATHDVVGGGANRDAIGGQVEPDRPARGCDRRETRARPFRIVLGHREKHGTAGPSLFTHDRTGDQVPRRQLTLRLVTGHEAFTARVEQFGPLPSQRFRQQESRCARHIKRRGMELHEFKIRDPGTGKPRQHHTVAGSNRWIGRFPEDLPSATSGQQDRGGMHLVGPAIAREARADAATVADDQLVHSGARRAQHPS